ncbi:CBS domain-containing protein [Radiobacillus deserti]|uniref:CBS domain-containing protein n=1 Tax=Radiobacillus deserti TaxID=2594883 RepID=A0A516KFF1_9BACI|nr:CBS domain-containing protein [Radiobacillus deserti]QDP40066.1 CBS domain-containing protein [Radiobacillus deserti]
MKSVKEIMSTDVSYCSPSDTMTEAATKMRDKNVGAIPICGENRELMGMITDRDLVIRGLAERKNAETSVKEVMSSELYSCSPQTSVQEASQIMAEKQIRRLPVIDGGELVGMLALGDLALEHKSNEAAGRALEDISVHNQIQ